MTLINYLLFGILTGSFSVFIVQICFDRGNIFRKYYNFITYLFSLETKKTTKSVYIAYRKRNITGIEDTSRPKNYDAIVVDRPVFSKNKYIWLYKVLGGCVYCFGTWICIAFYFMCYTCNISIMYFCFLFLTIGANYVGTLIALKLGEWKK